MHHTIHVLDATGYYPQKFLFNIHKSVYFCKATTSHTIFYIAGYNNIHGDPMTSTTPHSKILGSYHPSPRIDASGTTCEDGALVELITFNRRVMGSTPALAVT